MTGKQGGGNFQTVNHGEGMTPEDWRAYREEQKRRRAKKYGSIMKRLDLLNVPRQKYNHGQHIIICFNCNNRIDLWPSTGRWHLNGSPPPKHYRLFKTINVLAEKHGYKDEECIR